MSSDTGVKFAYWVPNVSGGLVISKIPQRTGGDAEYNRKLAQIAEEAGVDAEVIDLRTLVPLDIAAVERRVKKTGRCVIVHEAPRTSGFGAELSALVQERCFHHLEAPILRVTGWDTPYPHAFEWDYFPGPERVAAALKRTMAEV